MCITKLLILNGIISSSLGKKLRFLEKWFMMFNKYLNLSSIVLIHLRWEGTQFLKSWNPNEAF